MTRLWAGLSREIGGAGRNFHSVDFLRGIAALAIVIFHFKNFSMAGGAMTQPPTALDGITALRWLDFVREKGSLAVMGFWAISGFVFMNVYAGRKPGALSFVVRRFARLYPLHFLTLIVIALLQIAAVRWLGHAMIFQDNDAWNFMLHLFLASAWGLEHGRSFNFPIWSVSAEILIYALFWLAVRFLPLNLLRLAMIWLLFEGLAIALDSDDVVTCGAYFFSGALTFAIYRLWRDEARLTLLALAGGAVLASIVVAALSLDTAVPETVWLMPAICGSILALVCVEMLWLGGLFRKMRPLGDITYSSYLWHSPLQVIILLGAGLGLWRLESLFTDVFFLAYLASIIMIATFSFRWIERPAQQWVLARFDPETGRPAARPHAPRIGRDLPVTAQVNETV